MTKDQVLDQLNLSKELSFVKDNLLYLVLGGSRAYGTNHPESDFDYRGVCVKPLEYYLGTKAFEQREDKTHDITIYDINKFFALAKNLNPNILELLFIDNPKHIIYEHPIMTRIKQHRHLFISKKAQYTFLGYAKSQLDRMKRHKRWIDTPPKSPQRGSYDIGDASIMSYDKLKGLNNLSNEDFELLDIRPEVKTYIQMELQYKHDLDERRKYDTWVTNRNPKRAKLEAKCGYDGKHTMHLFRLIRMAKEIAIEGTLHIDRTYIDADFLTKIRNGDINYRGLMALVNQEEAEVKRLFEWSTIPHSVDHKAIDALLINVLEEFLGLDTTNQV